MKPTLTAEDAARQAWDIAVIGAGPAGAMAASAAADGGARVLLVDRARFPRTKICGCCLNGAALELLERARMGHIVERLGAPKLAELQLAYQGRFARIPLSHGVSLSRDSLDDALIAESVSRGAQFLDRTQALLQDAERGFRQLVLKSEDRVLPAKARVVIVASGLGARVFDRQLVDPRPVSRASRIGAGAALGDAAETVPRGQLRMACHRHGYVGLVQLEDGRLDVATALDSSVLKQRRIADVVAQIIEDSGWPVPPGVETANWQGTSKLTQRRERVFGERYFVVGDAAGYIEPFTGEGIAWALATGQAVVPFVLQSLADWPRNSGAAWAAKRTQLTLRRMRLCRAISYSLRYPALLGLAIRFLARSPALAQPIVRSLNASFP